MVPVELRQKFWDNATALGPEECWLWKGSKRGNGYGHVRHNGVVHSSHRLSWEVNRGPIPYREHVLHKCDVQMCVNPNHLFLGSHLDNMKDRDKKFRGRKSKFDYKTRQEIKKLVREKLIPREDICKIYGLSNTYLSTLINRTHI